MVPDAALHTIRNDSRLWGYLSDQQRVLLDDGLFLVDDSVRHLNEEPTDYSYLVFPFAKMYEGFLKQLFSDTGIIRKQEYEGDRFRIGRALSPTLVGRLGSHSAYGQLSKRYGIELADELWHTWKYGRNLVFHYFPHNYRLLTRTMAVETVHTILQSMLHAVERMHPHRVGRETKEVWIGTSNRGVLETPAAA